MPGSAPVDKDTIAAIATAAGRGGVGIVRISGALARPLTTVITGQAEPRPRFAHYGDFSHPDTGEVLDQGIALFFENPHSFTGEDVLELQGHGGTYVMQQLLAAITAQQGVRLARPGEFSERAFLNDKLDLAQAEAIADLIDANSAQAAKNALNSLRGGFSNTINQLVDKLTNLRLYVEAAIDFPEEEVDFLGDTAISSGLLDIEQQLSQVFQQAKRGALLREGITVVIAGKPNAGKSSLLNALSGEDSAIVTDIAGTTRDLLREQILLDGLPVNIIDTAGLRHSDDTVEQIGMERARQAIEKADHLILIVDVSQIPKALATDDLQNLLTLIGDKQIDLASLIQQGKVSLVYNKTDLIDSNKNLPQWPGVRHYPLSTKTRYGLEALVDRLKQLAGYDNSTEAGFTARQRHLEALTTADQHLLYGKQQLEHGAGELLAEELRLAQQALGEITGRVSADDLLGKIFSSFCIGK